MSAELYIANVEKLPNDSIQDIKYKIINCAGKGDVKVLNVWVVKNRYREDMVGCKITVPIDQYEKALEGRFWPENIKSRRWYKNRDESQNSAGANGQEKTSKTVKSRVERDNQHQRPHYAGDTAYDRWYNKHNADRDSTHSVRSADGNQSFDWFDMEYVEDNHGMGYFVRDYQESYDDSGSSTVVSHWETASSWDSNSNSDIE